MEKPKVEGSHPTWVRGLKLVQYRNINKGMMSHPTWVRGLKQGVMDASDPYDMSHPTWVRGLKQLFLKSSNYVLVAPYVGAWIETSLPYLKL